MNNTEKFGTMLAGICRSSRVADGRPLRWTIIVNPIAGGFTIRSRWKENEAALISRVEAARGMAAPGKAARDTALHARASRTAEAGPSRTALEAGSGATGLVTTRYHGHTNEIVRALLDEMAKDEKDAFHLIITAGGDGTHYEAQTVLFGAPAEERAKCAIVRLPLGTGNDGSDGPGLGAALDLLSLPSKVVYQRAARLRTSTAGKGPFLAFNILSLGLDAFVTHMTNKMKGAFPGDSYKLWVDIASLFYDRIYKVAPMRVEAFDGVGNQVMALDEPLLLTAVGVSGRRTYGSKKRVLPDARNVCALRQMPLLRKLALKERLIAGTHVSQREAVLCGADRVEFTYGFDIRAQMDGESVLLKPEDFPAVIELTEAAIPILKPAQA